MSLFRTTGRQDRPGRPADRPTGPAFSAAEVSSAAICPPNATFAAEILLTEP